jgi:hypothetical protein
MKVVCLSVLLLSVNKTVSKIGGEAKPFGKLEI